MNNAERIERGLETIRISVEADRRYIDRLSHEIRFAQRLIGAKPEKKEEWQPLVDRAMEYVEAEVKKNPVDMRSAVEEAEKMLEPIGKAAKEYTLYCVGHAHTIPGILTRVGVKRYYFCRGGKGHSLFWWQAPDGSRVLAFDDGILWYNGEIGLDHVGAGRGFPDMTHLIFDFEKVTGLKEYLFVYGVGDHGGGPTRRDLVTAMDMNTWPIFPNINQGWIRIQSPDRGGRYGCA